MTPDADLLVIGGGPVGLAVAIEGRLAGLSVIVVEPRATPVDKACGEGLMPGAVEALARLGVDPEGHTLTGIRYLRGAHTADHLFAESPGRGVRRTVLHAALAARARELGAVVVPGRAGAVEQDASSVWCAGLRGRWLLACDGLHSTVRRQVDLSTHHRLRARRFGVRRHFRVAPWTDLVEVHWGRSVEAYVTPVADDVVGVALLGPAHHDYDRTLDSFVALRHHLGDAERLGPARGAGPMYQQSQHRTAGRVRLVGDASGYVDALTGEGVRVGLAQAHAAVATLGDDVRRSNAAYEKAWTAATRDYRVLTSGLLAAAAHSPAARHRAAGRHGTRAVRRGGRAPRALTQDTNTAGPAGASALAIRACISADIGGSASSANQAASVFSPSAGNGSPETYRNRNVWSRYCARSPLS